MACEGGGRSAQPGCRGPGGSARNGSGNGSERGGARPPPGTGLL